MRRNDQPENSAAECDVSNRWKEINQKSFCPPTPSLSFFFFEKKGSVGMVAAKGGKGPPRSSVGECRAASYRPHIHKANKASFFNDFLNTFFFAAACLDLLVIMVSSNAVRSL